MEQDTAMGAIAHTEAPVSGLDRSKYKSPPPPPTSMTPPPSSQAPQLGHSHARTPTPTHSHLSSPPPTVKSAVPQSNAEMASGFYSADQIANATVEDLRNMINEIGAAYREARASAAHHHLQYNLLRLESSEIMNRMGVELEMSKKEVEVMQVTAQRSQSEVSQTTPKAKFLSSPDPNLAELRSRCHLLEIENERLQRRLADAKTAIVEREAAFSEENGRLKERIRKNRDHQILLRRSNSVQEPFQDVLATPQHTRSTQGRETAPYSASSATGRDKNFDALLLAASQEAATTPSTPTSRETKGHRQGHSRGAHSMSSIPSTPLQTARSARHAQGPYYVEASPSVHAARPGHERGRPLNKDYAPAQQRRQSRDSTISASDLEQDLENESGSEGEFDHNIAESPASQEAASLLRKSASFRQNTASNSVQSSFTASNAKPKESLTQGKLPKYQVQKNGSGSTATKRKAQDDKAQSIEDLKSAKKARYGGGVGLGIGWATSGR